MIFCTEPFRIAYAGRLNVVCFDKTGTLTKDEMMLKGVVAAQDVNIFTGQSLDVMEIPSLLDQDGQNAGEDSHANAHTHTNANGPSLATEMIAPEFTTTIVRCIMGCCHDLVQRISYHHQASSSADNLNILGDPLEFVSFAASGFKFLISSSSGPGGHGHGMPPQQGIATNHMVNTEHQIAAHVLHKYPFSSDLKRMSVMVQLSSVATSPSSSSSSSSFAASSSGYGGVTGQGMMGSSSSSSGNSRLKDFETVTYIFCKGAPEIIQPYLRNVPEHYTKAYQYHMQAGKRVLALAYKLLPTNNIQKLSREQAEKDLYFAGFLIFDCDLKADSKSVIKELKSSSHRVVMITGDSVYTAVNVGKRLAIVDNQRSALVLHPILVDNVLTTGSTSTTSGSGSTGKQQLVWRRLDSVVDDHEAHKKQDGDVEYNLNQVQALTARHVLCVTGAALDTLPHSSSTLLGIMKKLCPHVTIFARVSPIQKEKILLALNDSGLYTLMCGDGTNDVGALKAAHVGVSIINNPKLESIVEEAANKSNVAASAGSSSSGSAAVGKGKKGTKAKGGNAKDRIARAMLELQAHESDPSIVKLGDASIASPFTAKRTSIDSVLTVIRQGRCTLVTTIQVCAISMLI
jgi:cation-transporting ATPase 13A1